MPVLEKEALKAITSASTLKNQKKDKSKRKRAEKLINIRTNINEIESRKAIEGNNQTKVWSFGEINKIHTPQLLRKKKWKR